MLVDRHATARKRRAPPLPLDLQREAGELNRVIPRHDSFMLQAEDPIKVCALARHEGRSLLRRRDREPLVELADIAPREEAVGSVERRDLLKAQLLRQSPLPSAEASLATASGLRRVGRDELDVQLSERTPDLRQDLAVNWLAGLRRQEEVARPVTVERAEESLPFNHLADGTQHRAGGLFCDELRVVNLGGRVVE